MNEKEKEAVLDAIKNKDNGNIIISKKTQALINNERMEIALHQGILNKLLTVVYNETGKEEDYEPNKDFTELTLIEKKEE